MFMCVYIYKYVFLTPHTGRPEILTLTVSVFLCTFEQSALLLKKSHTCTSIVTP